MVGVAVKFTVVPAHTVLAEAVIDTLTGNIGFTVKVALLPVNVVVQPFTTIEVIVKV